MKEVIIKYLGDKLESHEIVEEVGELIRCKDCKWQGNDIRGVKQCMLPNGYTPLGNDDDYCSYAERKEG